jgi:hypothetical protein
MPACFIDEHVVEVRGKSEPFLYRSTKFSETLIDAQESLKGRIDLLRNNRDCRVGGNREGRSRLGTNEATKVAKKNL